MCKQLGWWSNNFRTCWLFRSIKINAVTLFYSFIRALLFLINGNCNKRNNLVAFMLFRLSLGFKYISFRWSAANKTSISFHIIITGWQSSLNSRSQIHWYVTFYSKLRIWVLTYRSFLFFIHWLNIDVDVIVWGLNSSVEIG